MTEYTPRVWSLGEVCEHGSLGRSCPVCEAQHELEWTRAELAACEAEVERLRTELARVRFESAALGAKRVLRIRNLESKLLTVMGVQP